MRLSAVRNVPMHCITSGGRSDACLSRKSLVPVCRRTILACSVRRSLIMYIPCIGGCLSSLCSPYCSTARCSYDDTCLDTCTPPSISVKSAKGFRLFRAVVPEDAFALTHTIVK